MAFDLLDKAASELTVLCQAIETGADIDQRLSQLFQKAEAHLSTEIDRRKAFLSTLQARIVQAHNYMDEISSYTNRCELIIERLKEQTKEAIISNPDLPWHDSFGSKLSLVPSPPKVVVDDEPNESDCERFYLEVIERKLNKVKLKDAILRGEDISWAHLEHNVHVRGL